MRYQDCNHERRFEVNHGNRRVIDVYETKRLQLLMYIERVKGRECI